MDEHKTLPDFLCIGTQKGGTTTLHRLLSQQNDIYMPALKEIHYFDLNFNKGIEWYKKFFKEKKTKQIAGETTPFYLFHPEAPERIKKTIPNIKLITLLRNPVERTISHIFHAKKRGFETLTVAEALKAEEERLAEGSEYSLQKHSYMKRSQYLEQLDRYERIFEKKQILVLKSEDLFNSPNKTFKRITEFLDITNKGNAIKLENANIGDTKSEYELKEIRKQLRIQLESTISGVQKRYGFSWE